ncbi:hypothetical protein FO519_008978 [Halicephalobus sp. NKZ332]|nr:hypothetical protein FO519_008978 [Halicephalobus sp. NKZ332]
MSEAQNSKEYKVVSINEDGSVTLSDPATGENKDGLRLPEGDLGQQIKDLVAGGKEVLVTVITEGDQETVTEAKETPAAVIAEASQEVTAESDQGATAEGDQGATAEGDQGAATEAQQIEMTTLDLHGTVDTLKPEHQKYAKAFNSVGDTFEEAYKIFSDSDYNAKTGSWKLDSQTGDAVVHSKSFPFGHVFALTATLDAPIDQVFNATVLEFEKTSSWSSNIVFSNIIVKLTEHVDIVHYANPDVMIVKSRDFVTARLWRKIGNQIYIGARSVEADEVKETKDRVRGKLHLGCGRLTPLDGNKTKVEYLLSIDFKGLIPKGIVNTVMGKLILKDFEETAEHFKKLTH